MYFKKLDVIMVQSPFIKKKESTELTYLILSGKDTIKELQGTFSKFRNKPETNKYMFMKRINKHNQLFNIRRMGRRKHINKYTVNFLGLANIIFLKMMDQNHIQAIQSLYNIEDISKSSYVLKTLKSFVLKLQNNPLINTVSLQDLLQLHIKYTGLQYVSYLINNDDIIKQEQARQSEESAFKYLCALYLLENNFGKFKDFGTNFLG